MPKLSKRVSQFTDSVIRRMTRISDATPGAINLSQGFPDFDPPKPLLDALEKAENENDRLIRDYAEAIRRIAQAEAVVKPSERFRIDDAKTKLKRMERHKQMAAGMCEMLRHDAQEMRDGQLRFEKPTLISAAPENGLFLQEAMDRLLRGEKEGRKELAAWFPVLVQGGKTADLRRTMKQLGRGAKEKDAPAVQLLLVAMETAMQEENA